MKFNRLFIIAIFFFAANGAFAQAKFAVYNPEADAKQQVSDAVSKAAAEHKNVFLFIGGNWCGWCRKFYNFSKEDYQIDSLMKADFVVEHINFSKENRNLPVMKDLDFPQRFGFPVFVILDENGKRIHTQNSGYLESGDGYSKQKVMEFLLQWSPAAMEPSQYEK
ncbi:MAG: thioredoxin family protein [Bacteroidetes bacterium]|jgi:thioredoxin-related protein|nr:thioredoxin family protein [Bacteroidota bacterium]